MNFILHEILQEAGVGVYTMTNISHYQAGLYSCQASNGVGRPVTQTISLTVLCKWTVDTITKYAEKEKWKHFKICQYVTLNPEPMHKSYQSRPVSWAGYLCAVMSPVSAPLPTQCAN